MRVSIEACDSGRHKDSLPVPATETVQVQHKVYSLCAACIPSLLAFFSLSNGASRPTKDQLLDAQHLRSPNKIKREAYAKRLLVLIQGGTVHPFELKRRSKLRSKAYGSAQSFLYRHRMIESVSGIRAGVSYGLTKAGQAWLIGSPLAPPPGSHGKRTFIHTPERAQVLRYLADHSPLECRPRAIRKAMALHPKRYHVIVDYLAKGGYITNVGGNKAGARWSLTATGKQALKGTNGLSGLQGRFPTQPATTPAPARVAGLKLDVSAK